MLSVVMQYQNMTAVDRINIQTSTL